MVLRRSLTFSKTTLIKILNFLKDRSHPAIPHPKKYNAKVLLKSKYKDNRKPRLLLILKMKFYTMTKRNRSFRRKNNEKFIIKFKKVFNSFHSCKTLKYLNYISWKISNKN